MGRSRFAFVRLAVPVVGLASVASFVWQSGTLCAGSGPEPSSPGRTPQASPRVVAEGRVVAYPGAEVVVGSETAGRVMRIDVTEKSVVRAGEVIAELRSDDLAAARDEALARVAQAEADLRFATRELEREDGLMRRGVGTAQNQDQALRIRDAARARIAEARATAARYEALIDKCRIRAPIDGVVTARFIDEGETVEAFAPIVTIVNLERLRVEAEVDEFDTARVALDLPVRVTAEGYAETWVGRVEEIPDAVIPRRIRPEDPGRATDARVLPVKIAIDGPTPLKLGQRVELSIALGD